MLYSAVCIRNDYFWSTGTIRVRIFKWYTVPNLIKDTEDGKIKLQKIDDISTNKYFAKFDGNISENPHRKDEVINQILDHEEFEALVFSSLAGGKNYGLFSLPQVNSKGIVAFLEGDFEKPIWIGSFFEPIKDENFFKIGVNIPTDRPFQEGPDTNGAKNNQKEIDGDESTIIFRQKHTFHDFDDEDDLKPLNWENVRTSNLYSLDQKKVRLIHFSKYKPKENGKEYEKETKVLHWQDFAIDRGDTGVTEYEGQEVDTKNGLERVTFTVFNEENMRKNTFQMNEGKTHIRIENKEDGPEKKGEKDKTIRNYDIIIDQGKLHILTNYEKDSSGNEVKKSQEVIIEEEQFHIDIKDDKNRKRHFSTMNVERLHSKISDNNSGKTNETIIDLDKSYNKIEGSSGFTEYHFSTLSDALKYVDYIGNTIKANSSGIQMETSHGTNTELRSGDVIINNSNLKVLL